MRIFGTVLAVPRLRAGMKAELGALYPLLLLRPIESERWVLGRGWGGECELGGFWGWA